MREEGGWQLLLVLPLLLGNSQEDPHLPVSELVEEEEGGRPGACENVRGLGNSAFGRVSGGPNSPAPLNAKLDVGGICCRGLAPNAAVLEEKLLSGVAAPPNGLFVMGLLVEPRAMLLDGQPCCCSLGVPRALKLPGAIFPPRGL